MLWTSPVSAEPRKSENANASKTDIHPWHAIRSLKSFEVSVDLSPILNGGNTTSAV
jgi:hypothetical protein